jgi:hypothetical protein
MLAKLMPACGIYSKEMWPNGINVNYYPDGWVASLITNFFKCFEPDLVTGSGKLESSHFFHIQKCAVEMARRRRILTFQQRGPRPLFLRNLVLVVW